MFNGKIFFITGATGFVGTNIIKKLIELNEDIKIIGTYNNKIPQIFHSSITYLKLDLRIPHVCDPYLDEIDYLIMTAGYVGGAAAMEHSPKAFLTDSTLININVLESIRNVKKCLFISSSMVYPLQDIPLNESMGFVDEPYYKYFSGGWGKRIGEIICQLYSKILHYSTQFSIIRVDNIYGPFDNFSPEKSHVIPSLIKKAVDRQSPFEIWGNGKDIKDFLYIDDLIDGIFLALLHDSSYSVFNIASGTNVCINDIVQIILNHCSYSPSITYNYQKPTTIPAKYISIDKAKTELGFYPKVSLEDGLNRTIKWYKSNK